MGDTEEVNITTAYVSTVELTTVSNSPHFQLPGGWALS